MPQKESFPKITSQQPTRSPAGPGGPRGPRPPASPYSTVTRT